MTDLLLKVDGEPVELSDVIWEGVGSCGCPFAWHVAMSQGEVLAATPGQAEELLFGDNAPMRKYYADNGATVRPIRRGNIAAHTDCPHTPRYGHPDADPPEGHEWATTDGYRGRRTHMRHIVPELPVGDLMETFRARDEAVAICGKTTTRTSGAWRSERTDRTVHILSKVPCPRCIQKANVSSLTGEEAPA